MNKITVLIADDHKLLRETLGFIIDAHPSFEVVASCGDNQETIEIIKIERPDIVLMDINMAPFSGIEATQKIKILSPSSLVIGMSVHANPVYAKKMLRMGARGYVTKNSPKDEIIHAMLKVNQGNIYVCQEIKNILVEQLSPNPGESPQLSLLTEREIQIADLIRTGYSSKEIAVHIDIKIKTVEVHRHNILQKLKLRNASSLVNFMHNNAHYLT